jgi:small neutral amino acid transporter SnatA (MarC family)
MRRNVCESRSRASAQSTGHRCHTYRFSHLAILAVAALVGTRPLDLFNVSLDAFMVAGGGVLAWMGFSMLSGQGSSGSPDTITASGKDSLTPLILFAASPGTITGVITLAAAHTRLGFRSPPWWLSLLRAP